MRNIFRIIARFIVNWAFNSLCIWACDYFISGIRVNSANANIPYIIALFLVSLVFTSLNLLVRPIMMLLTLPISALTSGMVSLVVNGTVLFLVSRFSSLFSVDSIWIGIKGGFLIALTNIVITFLIPVDDDQLYFDILGRQINRRSRRPDDGKKGLIVLEIDGLSYPRLMHAIESGKMSFLKEQIKSGNYTVTPYDCGIPSQTSSCQAGIMFGDNYNICAFRWYDKNRKKVISSNNFQDAAYIENRIIREDHSNGLLSGGLSINNIISGNAAESIFTASAITPKNREDLHKRNVGMYIYSLQPYMLTKSLIFTIFDVVSEFFEYCWAVICRKKPRLNRLHNFYPIIRAGANVFLRDVSAELVINEIYQNGPAMYTTFLGYDEIAHHSGPDSMEAMNSLYGIDRQIQKIFHAAEDNPGRQYDIFVISDHGQSYGSTFKQRYGYSLSDFIQKSAASNESEHMSHVTGIGNTSDNDANMRAALAALESDNEAPNVIQKHTHDQLENVINRNESSEQLKILENEKSDIWVLASGNLANVYFSVIPEKAELSDIEHYYPGLCLSLVNHPGIGMIIVQQQEGAIAIGKGGQRNLSTGKISGKDPLLVYGDTETRAKQLLYLSQFSEGGDIIIFSSVYEDGTVAAFEELIGSHGGMGGQQTEPFIFHRRDISVSNHIDSAREVFQLLSKSREKTEDVKMVKAESRFDEWRGANLRAEIKKVRKWLPLLREILLFQSSPYKIIASSPDLNGPGLLFFSLSILVQIFSISKILMLAGNVSFIHSSIRAAVAVLVYWFSLAISFFLSLKALREKPDWNSIIRDLMFYSVTNISYLCYLIPQITGVWSILILFIRVITLAIAFLGINTDMSVKKRIFVLPIALLLFFISETISIAIYGTMVYIFNSEAFFHYLSIIQQLQ